MTRVVLASASPGRRKVLRQAGIDPLVVVSGGDEDAVLAGMDADASPADATTALAAAKAESVVSHLKSTVRTDSVVIACDSMLYIDGKLRGKPRSEDEALRGWQQMAGRCGQLVTGHCLIRLMDEAITYCGSDSSSTLVRFGRPSESDLEAYIDSGEPFRVAGSFTIDGLGGWFIDGVEGDPSAVIGIGLPTVRHLLAMAGLSLAELWAANRVSSSIR